MGAGECGRWSVSRKHRRDSATGKKSDEKDQRKCDEQTRHFAASWWLALSYHIGNRAGIIGAFIERRRPMNHDRLLPTRRRLLCIGGSATAIGRSARSAAPGPAQKSRTGARAAQSLSAHGAGVVRRTGPGRRERSATRPGRTLKTKADAEAYIRSVREKIATCFGPFPEKTPLNAKVTGTVERDAYTIEKVIFESRPRFFVTANLYLPKGREGPRPGVVGSCGHSTDRQGANRPTSRSARGWRGWATSS